MKNVRLTLILCLVSACGQSGRPSLQGASVNSEPALRQAVQRLHEALSKADTTVIPELVARNAVLIRQGRIESVREVVFVHGPSLGGAHGEAVVWTIKDLRLHDGFAYVVTEPRSASSDPAAYGLTVWRWNGKWQIVAGHWSHR